jgi:hypothetical protein
VPRVPVTGMSTKGAVGSLLAMRMMPVSSPMGAAGSYSMVNSIRSPGATATGVPGVETTEKLEEPISSWTLLMMRSAEPTLKTVRVRYLGPLQMVSKSRPSSRVCGGAAESASIGTNISQSLTTALSPARTAETGFSNPRPHASPPAFLRLPCNMRFNRGRGQRIYIVPPERLVVMRFGTIRQVRSKHLMNRCIGPISS